MRAELEQLRVELSECRSCQHAADIAPITSLAMAPRVMIVGQAPGQVEAAGGKPFAGRAGKTLFKWLAEAGIDEDAARRKIYIAAVTRCYPGPAASGRGDRVPSVEEQSACSRWLERELAIIRPRVIIPVGKLAMTRFLPGLSLELLIGRAHRNGDAKTSPLIIPLPHPSGASSWIHQGNHPGLLRSAIGLIAEHVAPFVQARRPSLRRAS
jgi:uracil-DNA glycosylase